MFQDFAARQFAFNQVEPPRRPAVEEAAELIDRYPNLSEIELARLINLYRDFSALEFRAHHLGPEAGFQT